MPQAARLDLEKEEQPTLLITRACDMCRKKKIRCEVVSEICSQCIKYKTRCHFTPISVTRSRRWSARSKNVDELEKRLKWVENQLKRNVAGQQYETEAEPRNEPRVAETRSSDQSQAGSSYLTQKIQGDEPSDSALTIAGGSLQASDSGASFQKTFPTTVPSSKREITPWNLANVKVFTAGAFKALPPKDKAANLISRSFQGFHSAFPLFDQAIFIRNFESLDSNINDPGWWASLNVVLALAHRFQGMATLDRDEDYESLGYLENALAVSSQLTMMHSTLSSVQALLGMSLVMLGTPNQGPASVLIASAIKLAQIMGLHRRCQEPGLGTDEIEQRKRVFWVAYCVDKEISLQTGQPPAQDDDDMDVELPIGNSTTQTPPGEPNDTDFFNFRVRLAIIQGQIYKRLCSVKASKQSLTERLEAAKELEAMLQTWRASVPMDFLRDYCGPIVRVPTLDTAVHPVILQLGYFNSLAAIYGSLPTLPRYRRIQGSEVPVEFHLISAPITYATEARKAIRLLTVTPRRGYACIWASLHVFVSATMTLLSSTLSAPSNPLALADLKLIEPLLTLLNTLAKSNNGQKAVEMYQSCVELFERTRTAVEGLDPVGMNWDLRRTSRQSETRESLEDFLRRMENIKSGYDVDMTWISRRASRKFGQ